MANPLNLYATKVFSEQPLGLWPLDDTANYIPLFSESDQNLSSWFSEGVAEVVDASDDNVFSFPPPEPPFFDVFLNGIIADSRTGLATFTSPFALQPSDLNQEQETFSFGLYAYSFTKVVNIRLGFRYTNPEDNEVYEVLKSTSLSTVLDWAMFSESFELPKIFQNLELIVEVYYQDEGDPYEFVIQGLTAGQWAEEFQLRSFGSTVTNIPSEIPVNETLGVEARPYGVPTQSGYYLVKDGKLLAKNFGIPLVFGSRNSTHIYPNTEGPSLVVPGLGFMNRSGQFNRLTAEFWTKIRSNTVEPRKIFGPLESEDGLYVEGPFLVLRVADSFEKHFVREWDRPMLVNIKITPRNATLILNGDQVISFSIDLKKYEFASGENSDWLGFFAHEDVPVVQVDCVGIYPYEVPAIVAKRRWVYGQAVEPPIDIKGVDSSSSAFVDYSFSKYGKSYYFPSSSKWSSGNLENVLTEDDFVAPERHSLPQVIFNNKTFSQWEDEISDYNLDESNTNPFSLSQNSGSRITLRPSGSWEDTEGYLLFQNLNFLSNQTKAFYGLFERKSIKPEKEVLFRLQNVTNSEAIEAYIQGNPTNSDLAEIKKIDSPAGFTRFQIKNFRHALRNDSVVSLYHDFEKFDKTPWRAINIISEDEFVLESEVEGFESFDGLDFQDASDITVYQESTLSYSYKKQISSGKFAETVFYKAPGHKIGHRFFAGIDIQKFINFFGGPIANFLGTRQRVLVYVGGTASFEKTFSGDIHRVGFCTQRNLNKIKHLFNQKGLPIDYDNVFNNFGPEIVDAGDDYFGNDPSFWSLTLDGGDPYDFPAILAEEHIASYTLYPVRSFGKFVLDIAADSYWEDYVPLSHFSKKVPDGRGNLKNSLTYLQINLDYPSIKKAEGNKIDTDGSIVKAYISFQYLRSGSNAPSSSFSKKEKLSADKVVRPSSDWMTTKYEIVDNSIVHLPKGVDFSRLSVNIYLEMVVEGIQSSPIKLRSLQICGQAYGNNPTKVGTRGGADLIPYSKAGIYTSYQNSPALSIYKGSTPYLYQTSKSGVEAKLGYSNKTVGGISLPINKSAAKFFKIESFQMFIKYDDPLFPRFPVKIFEIAYKNNFIDFFLVSDSSSRLRGQIYATNRNSGRIQGGLMFFNNGIPSKRPVLYPGSWLSLGMSFPNFLDFGETLGSLRFTSSIMFNNLSYFQINKSDEDERFSRRQWFAVRNQLGDPIDWGFWAGKEIFGGQVVTLQDEGFTWQEVLFLSSIVRDGVDGSNIYNIFTGTERIVSDTDTLLPVGSYKYSFYLDTEWSSKVVNPV